MKKLVLILFLCLVAVSIFSTAIVYVQTRRIQILIEHNAYKQELNAYYGAYYDATENILDSIKVDRTKIVDYQYAKEKLDSLYKLEM